MDPKPTPIVPTQVNWDEDGIKVKDKDKDKDKDPVVTPDGMIQDI